MNELTKDQWKRSMSTGFGDGEHPINDDNPHYNTLVVKTENELEEGWKDVVAAGALGLAALKGGDLQASNPIKVSKDIKQNPATKVVSTSKTSATLDQSFIDYIKSIENSTKTGYNKQKKMWFPHKSFEGGSDTIGYGHKIQKGEDFSKGITDSQAEDLLKKDLDKAKEQVYKEIGNRPLTKDQLEMFVDFVFNMGTLKKFPKFTSFALKNDLEGMKSQYKRFAAGKELKGRNKAFLNRFLTESNYVHEGFYAGSKNYWISPSGKMIDIETEKFPLNDHATWAVVNVLANSDPEYNVAKGQTSNWVYDKYSGQSSVYTTMVEHGYIRCIIMTNSKKVYLDFSDHTDEWRRYLSRTQLSSVVKYAIGKEYKVIVDNIEKILYEPPTPENI